MNGNKWHFQKCEYMKTLHFFSHTATASQVILSLIYWPGLLDQISLNWQLYQTYFLEIGSAFKNKWNQTKIEVNFRVYGSVVLVGRCPLIVEPRLSTRSRRNSTKTNEQRRSLLLLCENGKLSLSFPLRFPAVDGRRRLRSRDDPLRLLFLLILLKVEKRKRNFDCDGLLCEVDSSAGHLNNPQKPSRLVTNTSLLRHQKGKDTFPFYSDSTLFDTQGWSQHCFQPDTVFNL